MGWNSWDGDDDALDDPEGPQDIDLADEDSDDFDTTPCPSCGSPVSELAEQCPHCGAWIVPSSGSRRHRPWVIVLAVALLAALLLWLV